MLGRGSEGLSGIRNCRSGSTINKGYSVKAGSRAEWPLDRAAREGGEGEEMGWGVEGGALSAEVLLLQSCGNKFLLTDTF